MKLLQRLKNLFVPEDKVSDGFHTFNELYRYRMLYNAAFLILYTVTMMFTSQESILMEKCVSEEIGLL